MDGASDDAAHCRDGPDLGPIYAGACALRPRGSFGQVARALTLAAEQPGTVRQLAARAQVGIKAARYTASRMVGLGELRVVVESRPAVLVRGVGQDRGRAVSSDSSAALDAELRRIWAHSRAAMEADR